MRVSLRWRKKSVTEAVPRFMPSHLKRVPAGVLFAAGGEQFEFGVDQGQRVAASGAGAGLGVGEVAGAALPQLLVQPALDAGELIDVAAGHVLSIALFWHCWNLESRVLARVSQALLGKARQVLQAV